MFSSIHVCFVELLLFVEYLIGDGTCMVRFVAELHTPYSAR